MAYPYDDTRSERRRRERAWQGGSRGGGAPRAQGDPRDARDDDDRRDWYREAQERGDWGDGGEHRRGYDDDPYRGDRFRPNFGGGRRDDPRDDFGPAGYGYGPVYGTYGVAPGAFSSGLYGAGPQRDRRGDGNERGFFERAGDEVASWFGDEDSAQRRREDHRGRGPKGYTRSDERIREDVSDRLSDDPDVDATEITVSAADGEVTLDGTVDSKRAKRRAEDCADSVSGVKHVQNNLRVGSHDAGRAQQAP